MLAACDYCRNRTIKGRPSWSRLCLFASSPTLALRATASKLHGLRTGAITIADGDAARPDSVKRWRERGTDRAGSATGQGCPAIWGLSKITTGCNRAEGEGGTASVFHNENLGLAGRTNRLIAKVQTRRKNAHRAADSQQRNGLRTRRIVIADDEIAGALASESRRKCYV